MSNPEILQALALASWQVPPFSIYDTQAGRLEEMQNSRREMPQQYLEARTIEITLVD